MRSTLAKANRVGGGSHEMEMKFSGRECAKQCSNFSRLGRGPLSFLQSQGTLLSFLTSFTTFESYIPTRKVPASHWTM